MKKNISDLEIRDEPYSFRFNIPMGQACAVVGKASSYVIWGVRNEDHAVVGTAFDPSQKRVGNEEFENWLLRLLEPKIEFQFFSVKIDEQPVVLLEISRSAHQPVRFEGTEFLRVGSYTKKLGQFPEKERELWRIFDQIPFEDVIATEHRDDAEVLKLLDYPAYFDLLNMPLPENRNGILSVLAADNLIRPCEAGGWNITNLGAILVARNKASVSRYIREAIEVGLIKPDDEGASRRWMRYVPFWA